MDFKNIRFERKNSSDFFKILNTRVNNYFKQNQIKKTGNWKIWIKTFVMFSLLITPYVIISIFTIPDGHMFCFQLLWV